MAPGERSKGFSEGSRRSATLLMMGRSLTESLPTHYIAGIVNNRKEVIQCLIVLRPGCRLEPGSSPLPRSTPPDACVRVRRAGPGL